MKEEIKIDNDCPTHGYSDKAKERFWKNPLTSHWACKCKGISRYEVLSTLTDETPNASPQRQ